MEPDVYFNSLIIFLIALVGGLWGLARKISPESLHLALSLAAGFFLGAVFLELLPVSFSQNSSDPRTIGGLTLAGFTLIYVIEKGIIPRLLSGEKSDGHDVVALTALFGLCVHSISEGAALALGPESIGGAGRACSAGSFLLPIALHKGIASLALGSLFVLAGSSPRKIALYLLLFALMTPIGAILTSVLAPAGGLGADSELYSWITALTAGIFLYVATADILPEVMHSRASMGWKLLLLSAGMLIMWGAGVLGG